MFITPELSDNNWYREGFWEGLQELVIAVVTRFV